MGNVMSNPIAFRPLQKRRVSPAGVVTGAGFPFQIRVASSDAARQDAFALRYRAYRALGYVEENAAATFADKNDALNSTVIFGAYQDDVCIGTLRVSFSLTHQDHATLPCAPYYPEVTELKSASSGPIVEMSRLAIDPSFTSTSFRTTLFAALVRAGFLAAQAAEVSTILIATKPEFARFYQYMLGFKVVGQPAAYPPGDHRIVLLAGSFSQAELRQSAQNAFFKITGDEITSMKAALGGVLAEPPVERFKTVAGL
jgi:N-acyl-L-homoserine lactone synthetase